MDQNVKSLATLQDVFRGSLDPEVVELIFTESDCVVNDALEKLLSITKPVSSSDNWSPDSENKSSRQNSAASKEDFSPCNDWRTTDRKTSKGKKTTHKASSFRDDKSNSFIIDATETQISVADSSEQNGNSTKEAVEPKDSSYHSTNSTLALHSVQSGIEVTDQPLSNELPPWPDYNPMKSFSGQPCNAYQRFPIPHNFQGQRFTGDTGYFHYVPQNARTYHPRSDLHAPSIRCQSGGFYPGQAFSKHRTRSEGLFLSHGKVLVLLRGLPGSGKTTLAQKLKGDGVILSTDDFFITNERYQFEQNDLAKAHEWNQKRAKDSMQRGVSPIIIDNTNMQAWEMRPYVSMAKRFGYEVMIKEPDTPWKWNTKELLKRNRHNVTLFSIQNMKERYEKDLTVEAILATSWEKLEKDNPKIETCNSNKDETRKHNSECIKPTRVPQEMETLRSHGSRSPIQDIDFSLSELSHADQSLEINKSFSKVSNVNNEGDFEETLLPKPQRTPKRRERASKSLERMQNSEDVKENPNKVLDSKEAKSENARPVSFMSEEEESVDDNVQKSIAGVLNSENTLSLKKEMENTGSSLPINPLITTDESMTVETNTKEFCSENYFAKEITKIESENDTDEETHEKAEHYLAKTNDRYERFKNTGTEKENSLENFKNDLSESELSGFQFLNTCFPDMDIQLLVDVLANKQGDVTKAVESILRHEDNSSEVESRKHDTSNISSPGKNSLKTSSCQKTSAYTALDQGLKPLQGYHFQEFRASKPLPSLKSANYLPHVGQDPGHFQMTLEPAVAIQLLELFGPIDTVSLEGDFSSNDLIVQVDSEFAKLLYNQWQKTIQNNIKEKLSYTEKQPHVSRTVNKEDSSQRLEDSKATDLRQIMDEQMAVEQSRQDQKESRENMAVVLKRQKLYAMFPGVDPLALKELFEANRYELQPTISMVETSCNLQAKPPVFQEKQGNWNSRSHDDGHGELKTEFQELQDPDYEDFRAEANTHYKLRDECFRKAAFAFSKKQGQLAQFYASQGHMHTEEIRQANRRAAARILEHKNSNGDQNSLDLHGLHVDEALMALEEKLIFSDWPKDRPRYLSVITGRGIHSKQGKAKIKPAVLEYLQRNNYRFEELQPGLLRVFINR
ncbi:NEDD4-binding protein 2-like isoform X2 [Actinia tenebrosa]|uniref:NEDD4-binding protein 2-like isoform X2 n=1 Tax=Actinia tenebrosa TaxID=6105 RepID=A0A6P8J0V4_ACTTE|nr:NEDD4-binding protein 2-like isoform X2 [Actinia tenebrosa]